MKMTLIALCLLFGVQALASLTPATSGDDQRSKAPGIQEAATRRDCAYRLLAIRATRLEALYPDFDHPRLNVSNEATERYIRMCVQFGFNQSAEVSQEEASLLTDVLQSDAG